MFNACLFTALLFLYPETPGLERYLKETWMLGESQLQGICPDMVDNHRFAEYEITNTHTLTVTFIRQQFVMQLPSINGRLATLPNVMPLRYWLGAGLAYIGSHWAVPVRMGPVDTV